MTLGDVYWLTTDVHPHVIVALTPLTVARITSNLNRAKAPGCVLLASGEANLPKQSVVLAFSTLTVAAEQLRERIGTLTASRVEELSAARRFVAHFG